MDSVNVVMIRFSDTSVRKRLAWFPSALYVSH